jgi:hypothetical protein
MTVKPPIALTEMVRAIVKARIEKIYTIGLILIIKPTLHTFWLV